MSFHDKRHQYLSIDRYQSCAPDSSELSHWGAYQTVWSYFNLEAQCQINCILVKKPEKIQHKDVLCIFDTQYILCITC